MDSYKKAIEKEFEEMNKNSHGRSSMSSTKMKLNGECGTYNNLFYVWEFKNVKFDINTNDDNNISGSNCKLISIPHAEFKVKTKSDDYVKTKKRNKKEERKSKKKAQ
jgi:hypothetical protein